MKKLIILLSFVLFFLLGFNNCLAGEESIEAYRIHLSINKDSSIEISESIYYNFGSNFKKGIYRTIPTTFKEGDTSYRFKVTDIEAYDDLNKDQLFNINENRKEIRIDLGSDVNEFTGVNVFHLKYKVTGVISYENEFDILHWNLIGPDWSIPINGIKATVTLPEAVSVDSLVSDCFVGLLGSMDRCFSTEMKYVLDSNNSQDEKVSGLVYTHKASLGNGRAMTVNLKLPKGLVSETEREEVVPLPLLFFILLVGAGFIPIFFIIKLFKNNPEKNYKKSVVIQYDVPDGVNPSDVGLVKNRIFGNNELVAEILSLATKGYIKIIYEEKKIFYIFKLKVFLFLKLKIDEELSETENKIMKTVFHKKLKLSKASALDLIKPLSAKEKPEIKESIDSALAISSSKMFKKQWFYAKFKEINKIAENEVFEKNFFVNNFKNSHMNALKEFGLFISLMFFVVIALVLCAVYFFPTASLNSFWRVLFFFGFFIFFMIIYVQGLIFTKLPYRTKEGIKLNNHIVGLKRYIEVAEKERMDFHYDPKKNPELFEKLLPFAVVLGLQQKWNEHLSDLDYNPDWYMSSTSGSLSVNSLNSMVSSLSTTSSSSSGGGGGAGGGAGGGGGGSR